jgi:hypothetical protein
MFESSIRRLFVLICTAAYLLTPEMTTQRVMAQNIRIHDRHTQNLIANLSGSHSSINSPQPRTGACVWRDSITETVWIFGGYKTRLIDDPPKCTFNDATATFVRRHRVASRRVFQLSDRRRHFSDPPLIENEVLAHLMGCVSMILVSNSYVVLRWRLRTALDRFGNFRCVCYFFVLIQDLFVLISYSIVIF